MKRAATNVWVWIKQRYSFIINSIFISKEGHDPFQKGNLGHPRKIWRRLYGIFSLVHYITPSHSSSKLQVLCAAHIIVQLLSGASTCGYGGIGRHAGFRFLCLTGIWIRPPLSAPFKTIPLIQWVLW